jgi:hypothetical protein
VAPPTLPPVPPPVPAAAARPDAAALVAPSATTSTPTRPLDLPDAATPARHAAPVGGGSPDQPAAQLPQATRPSAVSIQRRPPTRRLEAGDLICPECGEGNPTTRKFCSRCGSSLETAQVVKTKWWQKLFRKGPKKRKAGDRPSARRTRKSIPNKILGVIFGGAGRVVGVIFIVGGIVYGMVPTIRSDVNGEVSSVKNYVNNHWLHQKRSQVTPFEALSLSHVTGFPPDQLIDPYSNTYWSAPANTGVNETKVTFTFKQKFDLKNVVVYNGTGTNTRNYQTLQRPHDVHLVYSNGQQEDLTFADGTDKQTLTIHKGKGITSIQMFLTDYYPAKGAKDFAFARIDFFKS